MHFYENMNKKYPVQFTCTVAFLSVDIYVHMLGFHISFHILATNHHQYLQFSSCHFPSTKGSMPFSQPSMVEEFAATLAIYTFSLLTFPFTLCILKHTLMESYHILQSNISTCSLLPFWHFGVIGSFSHSSHTMELFKPIQTYWNEGSGIYK